MSTFRIRKAKVVGVEQTIVLTGTAEFATKARRDACDETFTPRADC